MTSCFNLISFANVGHYKHIEQKGFKVPSTIPCLFCFTPGTELRALWLRGRHLCHQANLLAPVCSLRQALAVQSRLVLDLLGGPEWPPQASGTPFSASQVPPQLAHLFIKI